MFAKGQRRIRRDIRGGNGYALRIAKSLHVPFACRNQFIRLATKYYFPGSHVESRHGLYLHVSLTVGRIQILIESLSAQSVENDVVSSHTQVLVFRRIYDQTAYQTVGIQPERLSQLSDMGVQFILLYAQDRTQHLAVFQWTIGHTWISVLILLYLR